jgi:hypothetical protein
MSFLETNHDEGDDYGFFREAIDQYNVHSTLEEDGSVFHVTEGDCDSNEWFEIELLVKLIASAEPKEIERIVRYPNSQVAKLHPIANQYNRILHPLDGKNERYEYSPLIKIFYDSIESLEDYEKEPKSNEVFSKVIGSIREQLNDKKFRRRIASQKSNLKRNEKEALKYVDKIFLKTQRVLPIRIDFYLEIPDISRIDQLAEIRKYFRRFLNHRRSNKYFENELGYMWKLEMGETRAGHIHCFFFLDGSKSQKHEFIALKIGEYWKKVTKGRGTFFSAHSKAYLDGLRAKGIGIGLGKIESYDLEKRSNLCRMVKYFFKIDQYVSVKLLKKMRVFGKGEFPHLNDPRRGRPRKHQITSSNEFVDDR